MRRLLLLLAFLGLLAVSDGLQRMALQPADDAAAATADGGGGVPPPTRPPGV